MTNWPDLFKQFPVAPIKGAIISEPQLQAATCWRWMLQNVGEDSIVALPKLAQKLGLSVKIDLRNWKFQTYFEGMRWVWTNLKNTFRPLPVPLYISANLGRLSLPMTNGTASCF